MQNETYKTTETCRYCERKSHRLLTNDRCVTCANIGAILFRNVCATNFDQWFMIAPDPVNIIQHRALVNEVLFMGWDQYDEIKRCVEIYKAHPEHYIIGSKRCSKGHPGLLTKTRRCVLCAEEKARTPRQVAIREGRKWYTPETPCNACHQIVERRVDNGVCRGCMKSPGNGPAPDSTDHRRTPDSVMMEDCPDLIISKADARLAGFKVYRTGKACKKGHTAYRYISTGTCVQCLRG